MQPCAHANANSVRAFLPEPIAKCTHDVAFAVQWLMWRSVVVERHPCARTCVSMSTRDTPVAYGAMCVVRHMRKYTTLKNAI